MTDAAVLTSTLDPDLPVSFVAEADAAVRPADDVLRDLVVDRPEGEVITILRLFHGAQDWPNLP